MSKYLFVKLARDLRRYWSQFVAVFLMAALSVLIYTGLEGAWNGLDQQLRSYAADVHLADVWVTLTTSDTDLLDDIAAMPEVRDAEPAQFFSASADRGDSRTALQVEVAGESDPHISRPTVIEGSVPTPQSTGIWIAQPYAQATGLHVGDALTLVTGSTTRSLTVSGIYYSAEKLYDTGSSLLAAPDPTLFSYALLPRAEFDRLLPGTPLASAIRITTEDPQRVSDAIIARSDDHVLRVTDRSSNDAVATAFDRVTQIRNLSVLFSFIFVLLAILAMYTSTRRLVDMQRREIATLKSLGYSASTIGTHFSLYGLVAGGLGAVLGLAISPLMSTYVLGTQQTMLSMPQWGIAYTKIPVGVFVVVVLVCTLGAFLAARPSLHRTPAEQLRPGVSRGRRILLERFPAIWNRTDFGSRWAWRDSATNPARFAMGVIGVAGSLMLLFAGFGMADSMNAQVRNVLTDENSYTARLSLSPAADIESLRSYADQPQLTEDLPVRSDPTDGFDRVLSIVGTGDFLRLHRIDGGPVNLDGLSVTEDTARRLDLSIGEEVTLHLPAGRGDIRLAVDQLIDRTAPQGFVISQKTWEAQDQRFSPTSMLVGADAHIDNLRDQPGVISVVDRSQQLANAHGMVEDLGGIFTLIRVFAILLAVIVLYSLGSLAFTERVRDYATLKVLGFDVRALRRLAARENVLATLLGVVIGIPAGLWFLGMYVGTFSTPRLVYGPQISLASASVAVLIAVIFSLLTTLLLGRRIRNVDMVGALKGVE